MNELIKITEREGRSVVSAKELYECLGLESSNYSRWAKNTITDSPFFEENDDWILLVINDESDNQSFNKSKDYALSIVMAKKIAMMARTEVGNKIRDYFLDCEKRLSDNKPSLPSTYAEALRQLATEVEEKEKISLQLEAKTEQLDESKEWITIKRFAKENGLNWRNISWRVLKALSVEHGYEVKKVFDANYGEVNIYHKNVFTIWNKSKPKYLK